MFRMTGQAADQVRKAAQQSGAGGMALRLAAHQQPGGAIDYRMGFDEASDEDIRFTSEGVEVLMTPEDAALLNEAVMDFVEMQPGEFQFIFLNPRDAHYAPPTE
jgi:iron-sulfur cluster assembly protein